MSHDLSDIEDWEDICRECRRLEDEEDPCSTCAVNHIINGNPYVHSSVTGVKNAGRGAPGCEIKTDLRAFLNENGNENKDSTKCEIGVHPSLKNFTPSAGIPKEKNAYQETPLDWNILIAQIDSGRDLVTPLILEFIERHSLVGITQSMIADFVSSRLGKRIHRTTITKRIKHLREIKIITGVKNGIYRINETFKRIYKKSQIARCENATPGGATLLSDWRVRIHGFQRAYFIVKTRRNEVNGNKERVNLHELLIPEVIEWLKKEGWSLVRKIKRNGSNASYVFKYHREPRVQLEVYKWKVLVEPSGRFNYEVSLEEFLSNYGSIYFTPSGDHTGAPGNGNSQTVVLNAELIEQDITSVCTSLIEKFVDSLCHLIGDIYSYRDLGWTGERKARMGKISKEGVNRPHIAFYDVGRSNQVYQIVEKYGKISIPELGMSIDCSPGTTTAEIEFKNTESKTSAENASIFVSGISRLLNTDVASGLAILGRSAKLNGQPNLEPLIHGGVSFNQTLQNELIKTLEKLEKLEEELEKSKERENELKKELEKYRREIKEIRDEIKEIKDVMVKLSKVMHDVVTKLVEKLSDKHIIEMTQLMNFVATLNSKVTSLEEKLTRLRVNRNGGG